MRVALFAAITFVLSCFAIGGFLSVVLALLTGNGIAPQPYHVIIGLIAGGCAAVSPAALAAWFVSRRRA